jgi:hypothetical protein
MLVWIFFGFLWFVIVVPTICKNRSVYYVCIFLHLMIICCYEEIYEISTLILCCLLVKSLK